MQAIWPRGYAVLIVLMAKATYVGNTGNSFGFLYHKRPSGQDAQSAFFFN